ncbi:MAG: cytochrome c oxidase subunit 3 [Anaerolineae bacterium]|jgi:heme/copper-type cytochrome/quinol oxidase subunit 3|nr:cytochrome c oxidase subunit 3 [Anaerolineae bacterium]
MAQAALPQAAAHGHDDDKHTRLHNENQKLAMWLYLASEVVIFSIMIAGYAIFRVTNPDQVKEIHGELGIALVTANTFLLLMSSWSMVMGLRAIEMKNRQGFLQWMGATAALGTIFLIGQWIEYRELAHLEITLAGMHPEFLGFGMRFYAPTAFHGAHVFIGVLWCLLVIWRGLRGRYDNNAVGVELFGLYWHFVDVVWIFLFTLIYLI